MTSRDDVTPDRLTPEQRALWDELNPGPVRVRPGSTLERARNLRVLEFQHICGFEGLPIPSPAAVLAALDEE